MVGWTEEKIPGVGTMALIPDVSNPLDVLLNHHLNRITTQRVQESQEGLEEERKNMRGRRRQSTPSQTRP